MKAVQVVSGISIAYFLIQCIIDVTEEAKVEALMATITMLLVFIMASHLRGIQNKEIADEIKENHKRNTNSSVPSNSITHKTNVPSTPTR